MTAQLPGPFIERMEALLGSGEAEAFLATYQAAPYSGLRTNTLKIKTEELMRLLPEPLERIAWCDSGFYTGEGARPGKHPYYHAGLYYIQEPSAMAPAELLDVQPGDRVLDLCAAPGGKSTQIAAKLQGEGLLVSNDLHPDRTKALAKNLELYGVRGGIVLNESPERLAAAFPHFFDRILVDAPCSGEGMFRKDEDMARQWGPDTPAKYAAMQRAILAQAARMLKPGGTMVYSTCTFAAEENEEMIQEFLEEHPDYALLPAGGTGSFAPGLHGLSDAARLWPHKVKGEGHFLAVLRQDGSGTATPDERALRAAAPGAGRGTHSSPRQEAGTRRDKRSAPAGRGGGRQGQAAGEEAAALGVAAAFLTGQLGAMPPGYPVWYGEHLYLSPLPKEALNGLKTVRPGWYVGQVRKGRFVPGHPLATALHMRESVRSLSLAASSGEAVSYLKGETLAVPEKRLELQPGHTAKGYVLVCIDGYSAGWGKWQDGLLKNEYPPGWRWT